MCEVTFGAPAVTGAPGFDGKEMTFPFTVSRPDLAPTEHTLTEQAVGSLVDRLGLSTDQLRRLLFSLAIRDVKERIRLGTLQAHETVPHHTANTQVFDADYAGTAELEGYCLRLGE